MLCPMEPIDYMNWKIWYILYYTILYYTIMYRITPYCTAYYCTVLYRTTPYLPVVQVEGVFVPLAVFVSAEHAVREVGHFLLWEYVSFQFVSLHNVTSHFVSLMWVIFCMLCTFVLYYCYHVIIFILLIRKWCLRLAVISGTVRSKRVRIDDAYCQRINDASQRRTR